MHVTTPRSRLPARVEREPATQAGQHRTSAAWCPASRSLGTSADHRSPASATASASVAAPSQPQRRRSCRPRREQRGSNTNVTFRSSHSSVEDLPAVSTHDCLDQNLLTWALSTLGTLDLNVNLPWADSTPAAVAASAAVPGAAVHPSLRGAENRSTA